MRIKFTTIGLIIFLLPMLINVVYFMVKHKGDNSADISMPSIIEMIEHATRILFAISICFLVSNKELNFKNPFLYIALVFLVLYYIVWIRYFVGGMDESLLRERFLLVPIPLAIFPVLYFIFASLWVNNYLASIIMIVFGIAHFIISYQNLNIK